MVKAAFKKKKVLLTSKLQLNSRKKPGERYICGIAFMALNAGDFGQ
jgi:hypothetical protein